MSSNNHIFLQFAEHLRMDYLKKRRSICQHILKDINTIFKLCPAITKLFIKPLLHLKDVKLYTDYYVINLWLLTHLVVFFLLFICVCFKFSRYQDQVYLFSFVRDEEQLSNCIYNCAFPQNGYQSWFYSVNQFYFQ